MPVLSLVPCAHDLWATPSIARRGYIMPLTMGPLPKIDNISGDVEGGAVQ